MTDFLNCNRIVTFTKQLPTRCQQEYSSPSLLGKRFVSHWLYCDRSGIIPHKPCKVL